MELPFDYAVALPLSPSRRPLARATVPSSSPLETTDRSFYRRHELNTTSNERCTPLWPSCLQSLHAFLPLQDPKVQLTLAYSTSEPPTLPPRTYLHQTPLSLCQWFIVLTTLIMLSLALLGLTNLSHALPLNDKLLHFFCLGIATGVFYFIFDVEE